MSGLLLVLLSGLTLFGVTLGIESEPLTDESDDLGTETEAESTTADTSGASNPLDIATAPDTTAARETETPDPEAPVTPEPETPLDPEADTITGTAGADTINAGAGADLVDGRDGDDTLEGGAGSDSVEGGLGDDVIYGTSLEGPDDGVEDSLSGGEGADTLFLGDTDIATGGAGADSFIRLSEMSTRALFTDFSASEDLIVIQHESDTPPTLLDQRIATDGVILEFSDGSAIELQGLTEAIDETLISFVDTRAA